VGKIIKINYFLKLENNKKAVICSLKLENVEKGRKKEG
jgi:hypothetical protein